MEMMLRVEVFAADVATAVEFYRRVLGFEEQHRQDDGMPARYVSMGRGAARIGIGASPLPVDPADRRIPTGTEIVLEVDDVDAEYTRIRMAGWPIDSEPVNQEWGLRDFRLVDPDGYYLRITSRT